ncbi:MAG: heme transporter HemC [Pelagibacteraceae bacterium]|nr:heme transporter HemC [Pelagibacteraceae bacterium]|tara:strand:- start:36846 stop:37541 length:696 start_codon:yes stop_codon:yes gene_type:complete
MKFLINPNQFNRLADILIKPIFIISLVVLAIGLIYSLFLSPNDYQQGATVRIMYIHVPSAWLALLTYSVMTIYSLIALIFKIPFGYIINTALAPIGAVFTLICIVSGSMWGKPMWGTWWVWDARLTSVAILLIVYLIIIYLNHALENRNVKEKVVAVFVLVGSINLPIIKFSVDWWNTLHQPASISKLSSPSIDNSMLIPLIIMTIAFTLIGILIALIRIKTEVIQRKINL